MIKEPLLPVTEKSYVSSSSSSDGCSSDDADVDDRADVEDSSSSKNSTSQSQHDRNKESENDISTRSENGASAMARATSTKSDKSIPVDDNSNRSITSADGQKENEEIQAIAISTDVDAEIDAKAETETDNHNLREKINSLEEQLMNLANMIQNLQIPRTPDTVTPPASTCSSSIHVMQMQNLQVNSMLETESPPPVDRQAADLENLAMKQMSINCSTPLNGEELSQLHMQLAPAPDLEYRSYTPNYEEELRNFRKSSRGLSMDNTPIVIPGNTTILVNDTSVGVDHHQPTGNSEAGESSSVAPAASSTTPKKYNKEEEKKEDAHALPPTGIAKKRRKSLENIGNSKKDKDLSVTVESANITNIVQRDIIAETMRKDSIASVNSAGAIAGIGLPPKSPEKSSRGNLSINTLKSEVIPVANTVNATVANPPTPKQWEEKMNTNAVVDFVRGLNIDSRQPDGSASEDVDANMEEFLRVPFRIENVLFFGISICFDSFLNVLTVTPLKFVWSCLCLICTIVRPGKGFGVCRFHRRHLYQLLRVLVIFLTYKFALCPISLGRLYHWIRGQAMLKLYVLLAMVEVFDRLMCSFGQDALDSLYWNTTRRPYHPRMIASTLVVLVYAIIHSLILFVHCATLNVAMNSADSALISLLIGGNFAEIKSTVFKKYNKQNLFKITTSDICERFKLILFLGLVLLLNCSQGGMNQEMVNDYIYMSFVILGAELICDWIKHSFITKFNFIKSSVYLDYSMVLAGDITGIGHDSMHLEHTHAVVKRLGFAQIPLICVSFRYLREAARYAEILTHDGDSNHVLYSFAVVWTHGTWRMISSYMLSFFCCLLGLKFLLGWAITRRARNIILYGPLEGIENDPKPKRRQAV